MAKAYRVDFTSRAAADVADVFAYVGNHASHQVAIQVTRSLLDAAHDLSRLPYRFRVYRPNRVAVRVVRSRACPPYAIYYRVHERAAIVVVLMIRHGARRPPTRFATV